MFSFLKEIHNSFEITKKKPISIKMFYITCIKYVFCAFFINDISSLIFVVVVVAN